MEKQEKNRLLKQVLWDYNITPEELEAVLKGEKSMAGHFNKEKIFQKLIESYSWYTVIQFFTTNELQALLTVDIIKNLRSPSLRKKYEFVRKRLLEIIPVAG